ncbi:MAG: glycosyltransferase family 9 protein [Chlamydiota bacterium]
MHVAIIKLSSLGDIVQSLPVAAYLKSRGHRVTWFVDDDLRALVDHSAFVDKVIGIPLRAWKKKRPSLKDIKNTISQIRIPHFDVAFDLQGNCKSALVMAFLKAGEKVGFGRETIAEWPALFACHFHFNPEKNQNIRAIYMQLVQKYFADEKPFILTISTKKEREGSKKIILATGSQWINKELHFETLQALVQRLDTVLEINWLFTSGSLREKEYASLLCQGVKRGKTLHLAPLPILQSIMEESDAVLSVDSLPLHLAGLVGVPTFSFFGPSSGLKYAPGVFYQGVCPYDKSFEKRCKILRSCTTGACIKNMALDPLFKAVHAFLDPSIEP